MSTLHLVTSRRSANVERATALLDAYLAEPNPDKAESLLGELVVSHVEPLASRVVSYRLRRHSEKHHNQIEDVTSEAVVAFLLHAAELRIARTGPVANLDAFVATLAGRACNDHFRKTNPAFHSLRNKLRYLFERYPDLARWRDSKTGIWLCGLAAWQSEAKQSRIANTDLDRIGDHDATTSNLHPADQLVNIFRQLGSPIAFNDLALIMARRWNVKDQTSDAQEDKEIADTSCPVDVNLAQRQWLTSLWKLIGELTRNQRAALLLNLRCADGSCGASLLVSTGVASMRQIAAATGIPDMEFAQMWKKLPLGDLEIAGLLSLTRQQVINLRKYSRAKLSRQLKQ